MHRATTAAAAIMALAMIGAGCGGGAPSAGPAWPRSAGTDLAEDPADDGGVSLEPAADHPTALEEADDDEEVPAVAVSAAVEAAASAPATAAPTGESAPPPAKVDPPPADAPPPMVEEIVIEIGD